MLAVSEERRLRRHEGNRTKNLSTLTFHIYNSDGPQRVELTDTGNTGKKLGV